MTPPVIRTGVDKLVEFIIDKGEVSIKDAARKLGVSVANIEEWADFLEEEKLISVDHSLSGITLKPRRLSKSEVKTKVKEYKGEQDAFSRKIESSLTDVDRELREIRLLRTEFKNLHNEIGDDIDKVQRELEGIDKFRDYEDRILNKKSEFEKEYRRRIDAMTARLSLLQKRMDALSQEKAKRKESVRKKKDEFTSLLEKEQKLLSNLEVFEKTFEDIEGKVKSRKHEMDLDKKEIESINKQQEQFKGEVEDAKEDLREMFSDINERQSNIKALEKDFLDKLKRSETIRKTKISDAKKVQQTFKEFFTKHNDIKQITKMLDDNYTELEHELEKLARRAEAYDMTVKEGKATGHIKSLEAELKRLNTKRNTFKLELKKLRGLLTRRVRSK